MRKKVYPFVCFLIILLFSCEGWEMVSCDSCLYEEPTVADLHISLSNGEATQGIYTVTIYKGKLEDGIVLESFETYLSTQREVSLNTEYTVTASTTINGNTYVSVGSVVPRVKTHYGCDDVCYYVVNDKIRLRLKYY